MAASNDEWELSKENIQPLQQGRKPEVLKVALSSNPEDLIVQQRQAFENELRTYTGDDPLSIWCQYIKWVEQNYPKGGRDGHIEKLIQQCLSILKDKKEYYDDNRFIEIWLKFAVIVPKPTEIYNYMYVHKIGCKCAIFFIAWSWELESQGSISKADQVLNEGIQRKAEPFEKLKSYRLEFEMRVASKVMANSEQMQNNEEPSRAAFAVLKPVKKKNVAPVVRVGDRVVDPNKVAMTLGRQQPVPKSNLPSGRVPFKIYSGENIQPSLPIQSESLAPFVLHSDSSKENEKKPSKWNKVKLKQMPTVGRTAQNAAPGFKLHCDEFLPSENTPKSVPKVSNILRARKEPAAPPLALFEPPDVMKKPMYDKEKVYGGAEEFSLEEIRAAEWFKKKKELEKEKQLAEQARILQEQQEQIKRLVQEVQFLKNKQPCLNESDNISDKKNNDVSKTSKNIQNDKSDVENSQGINSASIQKELFPNSKLASTFREASCIVRDFYNDTISHHFSDTANNHSENKEKPNSLHTKTSAFQDQKNLVFHDRPINVKLDASSEEDVYANQCKSIPTSKLTTPFKLFQDPTEDITKLSENAECHKTYAMNNDVAKEKGDVENIPPKGYVQETNKRDLSGILQPSKNIMFVPLEHQEESDEEDDIISSQDYHPPLQNETCNTELFAAAKFLASTPRAEVKTEQKIPIEEKDVYCQKSTQPSDEGCNPPPIQNFFDIAACSKPLSKTENKSSVKDHSTFRGYTGQLSVIMESSRETYKSSSSAGSSASATRLSHFDQCFSQEKSNTQKRISRSDEFKEPRPVVLVPESTQRTSDRESTLGILKEQMTLSQKAAFSADKGSEDNLKELKSASNVEGLFKKPIVERSDDTYTNKKDSEAENAEEAKIICTDIDPFDADLNSQILLSLPTDFCSNLISSRKALRNLEIKDEIEVGHLICEVENLISEGAYGKIYGAEIKTWANQKLDIHTNSKVALKVCRNSNNWELYICRILHTRLAELKKLPDVRSSVMEIISAHRYSNTLVLTSELSHQGTLLDLVNFYKKQQLGVPECITMYLTFEMLHTLSQIHECQVIHGDIKPDNILMRDISNPDILDSILQETVFLRFIDFGRSIDLKVFERGICFRSVLKDGCNEMKENKPWVFQLDWYRLCNCIHVLLFSEYMKVKKNPQGRWTIEKNIKRYWDQALWSALFDELLNIPACYQQPNISKFTNLIESRLKNNMQVFKMNIQRLLNFFVKR